MRPKRMRSTRGYGIEPTQLDRIWGTAGDELRDPYVRGNYLDVILPMTGIRRLDAILEPTKQAGLNLKATLASTVVYRGVLSGRWGE